MAAAPVVVLAILAALLGSAAPARADGVPVADPTTTTTTSTTTAPPAPTTTTTQPGGPGITLPILGTTTTTPGATTTTVPTDPNDPGDGEEAPAEDPPADPTVIEPGKAPYVLRLDPRAVRRILTGDLVAAQTKLDEAKNVALAAHANLDSLLARQAELINQQAALTPQAAAALRLYDETKRTLKQVALSAYLNGGQVANDDRPVVDPTDIRFGVDHVYEGTVAQAQASAMDRYLQAKAEVERLASAAKAELDQVTAEIPVAQQAASDADAAVPLAEDALQVLQAGSPIAINGFVFPVGDPHQFISSFGFPRMMGTPFAHSHQGNDIMAPMSTPLFACESGVLTKIGTDRLGGQKLWIVGQSGTRYYYAHLSAYAPNIHEGMRVNAGDVVGFVGNTGNAAGGPTHLHFEIHPGGGPAIDPYPILSIADQATKRARQGLPPAKA